MVNSARGEVSLRVGQTEYRLCLTLGALAEIEDKLEIDDITKISEVFAKPKVRHLIAVLLALIHGGGNQDVTERDLYAMELDLSGLQKTIEQVFKRSLANQSSPALSDRKGETVEPGEVQPDPEAELPGLSG
jgi:hypothetical protein